jgi:hypothetical protein
MVEINAQIVGYDNIRRRIGAWEGDSPRALKNAIRTEGFSLRATLMQAIRAGKPAPGVHLPELSIIARTINRKGGIRQHLPLLRIASAVTYDVDAALGTMRVGFTRRSAAWARTAAKRQQEGFTRPVTPAMREYFAARGSARRENRRWKSRRLGNPLMLRKSTTRFKIPPRPVIDPFWRHQEKTSLERIRANFRLIMRGQVAPGGVLHGPSEFARW